MRRWSNVDLHLVPNPGMPEPHPKREGAMEFPEEPPAQLMAQEFGALIDECFDLGNRDVAATWVPSFILGFAAAWLVLAATDNLLLFFVTLAIGWPTLWAALAWIARTLFTRPRFRRVCRTIEALAEQHHASHERMRMLWNCAWVVRARTRRLRFLEIRAEEAIVKQFPWLRDEAPSATSGQSPKQPA